MCLSLKCFIKWLIIFVNLVLSITGALILVLGVVLLILVRNVPDAAASDFNIIPILVIIFGCILTATNICGSIDKKICRLTYIVVMTILATITLILGIFVFESSKYLNESISELLSEWFNDEDLRFSFASIESGFECCGLTGPDSYNGSLPLSCCPYFQGDLDPLTCSPAKAYQDGCLDVVSWVLKRAFKGFGQASISISMFGFVGSGSTLLLLYLKKKP